MFIKDLSSQAPMEADWEYMDFSDQFGPQFIPLGDGMHPVLSLKAIRILPAINKLFAPTFGLPKTAAACCGVPLSN